MKDITRNARQALGSHEVFWCRKAKILGLEKAPSDHRDGSRLEGDLQEEGKKGPTGCLGGNGRSGQPGTHGR